MILKISKQCCIVLLINFTVVQWFLFSEIVLSDRLKFISALNQMRQYCFYELQWHHISEAEKVAFIIHPKKKQTNSINGHK